MTRKSRREIERAVDDLDDDPGDDQDGEHGPGILFETDEGLVDADGEPVPRDEDGERIGPAFGPTIIFEQGEDGGEGEQ